MLRATIEIVPFGDEEKAVTISTIEVANISEFGKHICDYACRRVLPNGDVVGWAYVRRYPRSKGAKKLVTKAIVELEKWTDCEKKVSTIKATTTSASPLST